MTTPVGPPAAVDGGWSMSLLGDFALRVKGIPASDALRVSRAGQRVLALLALHERPVRRSLVAEVLWGDSDERHASWSLRSTLHRLPRPNGTSPVTSRQDQLELSPAVQVDLYHLARRSGAFEAMRMDPAGRPPVGDAETLDQIRSLESDLLPSWYEDWVIVERERYHQLRLHALESLAHRLTEARRFGLAVHAALSAVKAEPLRESAHRAVIEAHLAEGNYADALRQYGSCRRQLLEELGVSPSRRLEEMVFGTPGAGRSSEPS